MKKIIATSIIGILLFAGCSLFTQKEETVSHPVATLEQTEKLEQDIGQIKTQLKNLERDIKTIKDNVDKNKSKIETWGNTIELKVKNLESLVKEIQGTLAQNATESRNTKPAANDKPPVQDTGGTEKKDTKTDNTGTGTTKKPDDVDFDNLFE